MDRPAELDLRSLGLFRIALCIAVAIQTLGDLMDLSAFYGPHGFMPPAVVAATSGLGIPHWLVHALDIYWWGTSETYQGALLVLRLLVACLIAAGPSTRWLRPLLAYLMMASIVRFPLLTNGGDVILTALSFWACFVPVDRTFRIGGKREIGTAHTAGTAGLLIQIFLIYCFNGLTKYGSAWRDGSAVARALQSDFMKTEFADVLLRSPDLTHFLTYALPWFEILFPFLLFVPFRRDACRTLVIVFLLSFHLVLALCFHSMPLPLTGIAIAAALLPTSFWNDWDAAGTAGRRQLTVIEDRAGPLSKGLLLWTIVCLAASLSSLPRPFKYSPFLAARRITNGVGLRQHWTFFAPNPDRHTGSFAVEVVDATGRVSFLNLPSGERTANYVRPRNVYVEEMRGRRWEKVYLNLYRGRLPAAAVENHLCGTYPDIRHFRIIFHARETTAGTEAGPPREIPLLSADCPRQSPGPT